MNFHLSFGSIQSESGVRTPDASSAGCTDGQATGKPVLCMSPKEMVGVGRPVVLDGGEAAARVSDRVGGA